MLILCKRGNYANEEILIPACTYSFVSVCVGSRIIWYMNLERTTGTILSTFKLSRRTMAANDAPASLFVLAWIQPWFTSCPAILLRSSCVFWVFVRARCAAHCGKLGLSNDTCNLPFCCWNLSWERMNDESIEWCREMSRANWIFQLCVVLWRDPKRIPVQIQLIPLSRSNVIAAHR